MRIALAADIAAGATDDDYYLYYGNPAPATPVPSLSETNVYLWYDDASVDRSASYLRGRIDNWHGSGWDDSLAWNAAGYYEYDNGNNFTSGYMRLVGERDVYVEAEFFHTGCYDQNITTGLLVRGVSQGGGSNLNSSNHYFASTRAEFPGAGCTANGYSHDGDIVARNRQSTEVDGPNPPDVVPNVWRRQGLAAWTIAPTRLAFWDEDSSASWAAPGFPSPANLHVAGTSSATIELGGFAGIMTSQDRGRLRNVLIRRYVEPEPLVVLVTQRQPVDVVLQKDVETVFDPVNNTTNPKAIPGSYVDYRITATNNGPGFADADSLVITDELPAGVSLFVGDLGAPGSGPVEFSDASGGAPSGLTFDYGGRGDLGDDVEFSQDGSDWNYVPQPDAQGFDSAVRFVRISPGGEFQGAVLPPQPSFELRLRVRVD